MTNRYPIKLSAPLKSYLWGGRRLKTEFGFETPLDTVAEAWVLSSHKDGQSVARNGIFSGKTLSEIVSDRSLLGINGRKFESFPILIKLIDAADKLSVQVHPDDEYALRTENEYGKTEMWYVLDCEPGAYIYYGLNRRISKEELRDRINNNTLLDVLGKTPVKKDDCIMINSGTIHAICEGILIAEIQQNSNTTYRVYDHGRVDKNGKGRELHIDKAIDVAKLCVPDQPVKNVKSGLLQQCRYFTCYIDRADGKYLLFTGEDSFNSLLITDGEGEIDGIPFKKGDCFFIPAETGQSVINGRAEFITARV